MHKMIQHICICCTNEVDLSLMIVTYFSHCKTGGYNINQDALHQLPRHQQTIILCLRTGHCRLNSHLKRTGVKTSAQCPLWRGGPNTRTLPTVLLTPSESKAADMAHLCVPQNQALGVCRGFVPDIQVSGTHGREDLVNATITSNAEEEEVTYLVLVGSRMVLP